MTSNLRVCVDARLLDGVAGGVQQMVVGLAHGLSGLGDGHEEFLFLTYRDADEWLRPHIGGPCRILEGPRAPRSSRWKQRLKSLLPRVHWAAAAARKRMAARRVVIRRSDGRIERCGVQVMHFTNQDAFVTPVPSIYHPHDLQHLHLPQFFSQQDIEVRERDYRSFCGQADVVAVASSWTKDDVIRRYRLAPEKVQVVPLAPTLAAFREPTMADLEEVRGKYSLPDRFAFFPAQTYAHKNHLGLLESLARLRSEGLVVPFVFSGRLSKFYPQIERRVEELRLAGQVRFLGFVSPVELRCLYRLCHCVVIPSMFEAASFPLWEAFLVGVPAACSNVTSLPDQAGDAAVLFDPSGQESIADAVRLVWGDQDLRRRLEERGRARVARFSWDKTARTFRAHYRRIAGRGMSDEDRALLTAPPLI